MKQYPKIETVFTRGSDFSVTKELRRPEYDLIHRWSLTEKIDGTNVRIKFARLNYKLAGRTDKAQFPKPLEASLITIVEDIENEVETILYEHELHTMTLYGEGYGPGIQKGGGRYRSDPGFILFDVRVNEHEWGGWLDLKAVEDTGLRLGLEVVPVISYDSSISEAEDYVIQNSTSLVAEDETLVAEGVVARPLVPLYDRRGERIMWKLKGSDYKAGKR